MTDRTNTDMLILDFVSIFRLKCGIKDAGVKKSGIFPLLALSVSQSAVSENWRRPIMHQVSKWLNVFCAGFQYKADSLLWQ